MVKNARKSLNSQAKPKNVFRRILINSIYVGAGLLELTNGGSSGTESMFGTKPRDAKSRIDKELSKNSKKFSRRTRRGL